MKFIYLTLLTISIGITYYCCTNAATPTIDVVKKIYTNQIDSLQVSLNTLAAICANSNSTEKVQNAFLQARLSYKKVEAIVEYYYPTTAKVINGAALQEVEADNPNLLIAPTGFQVMETLIFPAYTLSQKDTVLQEVNRMQEATTRLKINAQTLELTDANLWDAIRLQLFRIATLGISGYDAPIANNSMQEAAASLQSLQLMLSAYGTDEESDKFFSTCKQYLLNNSNFNSFNRMVFLRSHFNPLCKQLHKLQTQKNIPFFNEQRPLNSNAPTLFSSNIWNAYGFSDSLAPNNIPQLAYLGKQLFYNVNLSNNGSRNCASCHNPAKAFTDGLAKNISIDGDKKILRNTPTILYSGMQNAQFADSRVAYLEDQAKQVIENKFEMHGNLQLAAEKLSVDTAYTSLFTKAFSNNTITPRKIQQAIAAYIRTQQPFNSIFDKYMRNEIESYPAEAELGFNVFMGKGKCGTCHFMPLFNGTVPPTFVKSESEILGTPASNKPPYKLDADSGKYHLYKSLLHVSAFKTPTVRNAALTAPYMHNGIYKNLDELINFYNVGGGIGLGYDVPYQTLPPDHLQLTATESAALKAFIATLNDQ